MKAAIASLLISITSLLGAASIILFGIGCSTTGTGKRVLDEDKARQFAPILSAATSDAVIYAWQKDHNSILYLAAVREAIEQFAIAGDLSPAKLKAALYDLPIKELKTPEAQLIITPVLAAYKTYAGQIVKESVDADPALRQLVQAIVDGIAAGEDAVKQIQP